MKEFLERARRVLAVARKPKEEEYWEVVRITGTSMFGIGAFGFLLSLLFSVIS